MLKKELNRIRRKKKIRVKIFGTSTRPRLAVFRSIKSIYAQLIDDENKKTLCSSSDLKIDKKSKKIDLAVEVGTDIAKKAMDLKINEVVFDRGGFLYHGRVKALADSARKTGLKF